jgi:hypothetical protein
LKGLSSLYFYVHLDKKSCKGLLFSLSLADASLGVGGLFNLRDKLSTNNPFNSTRLPEI